MQHKLIDNTVLTINQASLTSTATACIVLGDLTALSLILPVYAYVEQEKIEITNISGQTITIVRGVGGTVQVSHNNGVEIKLNIVAENINELIDQKVNIVAGYGLSKNDFSNALLTKLNGIEQNANNYTHPTQHTISEVQNLQATLDGKVSKSLLTTKGDIFVNNGLDIVRLGKGADGQVLIADSNEPSGLRWGTLPQIYGSEFNYDLYNTYFSNPSTAFALYREKSIPVVPIGTYRVAVLVVGQGTSANASYKAQLVVDGSPQGELYEVEPKDGSTTQRVWFYGLAYVTFATAIAHTIRIETATTNSSSPADTYQSIIEFWRVS